MLAQEGTSPPLEGSEAGTHVTALPVRRLAQVPLDKSPVSHVFCTSAGVSLPPHVAVKCFLSSCNQACIYHLLIREFYFQCKGIYCDPYDDIKRKCMT